MSSDLLAEFDSFYTAPQNGSSNTARALNAPPTSALNDLSFLGSSSIPIQPQAPPQQQQWSVPASGPNSNIWGDLGGLQVDDSNQPGAPPVWDPWGNFGMENSTMVKAEVPVKRRPGPSLEVSKSTMSRLSTSDFPSNNTVSLVGSAGTHLQSSTIPSSLFQKSSAQSLVSTHAPIITSNILFDAADELGEGGGDHKDEDDEFGDFETATSSPARQTLLQMDTLIVTSKRPGELTSNCADSSFPYPLAPKSPSFQERNPFADLALSTSTDADVKTDTLLKTASPVTAWPVYAPQIPSSPPYQDSSAVKAHQDEDWGGFTDRAAKTSESRPSIGTDADAWEWDAVDSPANAAAAPAVAPVPSPLPLASQVVPPTNIPPPSILLSVFPQLFNLPQFSLFQAVGNQSYTTRNRVFSDPFTITFLRGYILLAVVSARIIAGRKLRWKRDKHLSQGMKIGPAGGKGSGMKLTGIDRAETAREDREVAELVRIWREQVGRLRSAVAAANASVREKAAHLTVPEISETVQAMPERGALTALKPCALCGLKREERIARIESNVEDSFGDWWVEHWGHRTCRNFWEEHEHKLRNR